MKKIYLLFLLLFLLFSLIGAAFLFSKNKVAYPLSHLAKVYNPREYTPEMLQKLLKENKNQYVVIDARTEKEYDRGHLPGALHADYFDTNKLIRVAKNKIPITYDGFSSMRGPYAAYILYQSGHQEVGILLGGITAWAEDIGEVESSEGTEGSVFMHPKDIFPQRKKSQYPLNQGAVEYTINVSRFAFNPNQLAVKHGQKVILHLISRDVIHGFALPEFRIEEELLPNEPKTISFIADRKGNFSFITNVISGKDYTSMVGNILIK